MQTSIPFVLSMFPSPGSVFTPEAPKAMVNDRNKNWGHRYYDSYRPASYSDPPSEHWNEMPPQKRKGMGVPNPSPLQPTADPKERRPSEAEKRGLYSFSPRQPLTHIRGYDIRTHPLEEPLDRPIKRRLKEWENGELDEASDVDRPHKLTKIGESEPRARNTPEDSPVSKRPPMNVVVPNMKQLSGFQQAPGIPQAPERTDNHSSPALAQNQAFDPVAVSADDSSTPIEARTQAFEEEMRINERQHQEVMARRTRELELEAEREFQERTTKTRHDSEKARNAQIERLEQEHEKRLANLRPRWE